VSSRRSWVGGYARWLRFWRATHIWLLEHTFSPSWLPGQWRAPIVGYLVAISLQAILLGVSALLFQAFPMFAFSGVLHVAVIALIALYWGAGPSLLATLVGVLLLRFAVLPPSLAWNRHTEQAVVEILLFVLAGVLISVIASHNKRARWNAENLTITLANEQAHLNAIIEAIPDVVALYDPQGALVRLNHAGLLALVRSSNGTQLEAQMILPTTVSIPQVLRGETLEAVEGQLVDTVGQPRFVSVSAAPLRDRQGQVSGAVCILRDITRLRQSEEALRESNQQMIDFLSLASHELRTPLTSIFGNYQLAQRHLGRLLTRAASAAQLAEEEMTGQLLLMRQDLQRGEQQARLMNRLVGDMLEVSRIQSDRIALRPSDCDLVAIVRDAVEAQELAWPNRTIALRLPDEIPVSLQADADRIGQVVANYLTNALKYSPADQLVEVHLRVASSEAELRVRDHGPGLSEAEQTHIWERFHRVPGIEVQDGSGAGLGLGLYISRTIIERHQGQVGIESAPGQGSTFWFTLPTVP
jgi:signal transduction histidine kinase